MHEEPIPGETNCLGWCNKKFYSQDKKRIRFCVKCRTKQQGNFASISRAETRLMSQTGSTKDLVVSE
jgi:hypothetical protein